MLNKIQRRQSSSALLWLLCTLLLAGPALHAFPPAPHYTIYGDVRDQYGVLLPADGSSVILYQGSKEILRQPLVASETAPFNYQIRMRIDMFRPSTSSYSSLALKAGTDFSLAVNIGGQLFSPIEMNTTPAIGSPAGRRRLNLTLGIDSDGDGIPDAWKESQLYHAGILPGPDGWDLSLIDRDGDFDNDGMSNWQEYIAGTYATDSESYLALEIKEMIGTFPHLQFYAIYGKSYTLEVSEDLKTWRPKSFSIEIPETGDLELRSSLSATTTGVMSLYPDSTTSAAFYRLTVR